MGLSQYVERELALARAETDPAAKFRHLERAHILSQYTTSDHIRVHFAMLKWGMQNGSAREVFGQVLRIVGAATKTAIGWVPAGNTGGANVSPIKPMVVPPDLAQIIEAHRN